MSENVTLREFVEYLKGEAPDVLDCIVGLGSGEDGVNPFDGAEWYSLFWALEAAKELKGVRVARSRAARERTVQ